MTTNLELKYTEQESSKSRHIMAFTFGMVIPAIFSMLDLPFIGMWIAGVIFVIYMFARQNSEASEFGMTVAAIAIILILGSVEMKDQLNEARPHEILPAYVMQ